MNYYLPILSFLFVLFSNTAHSQAPVLYENGDFVIKPVVGFQLWTSYTTGTERYSASDSAFVGVDDRLNFQLRRSRFGLKGQINSRFKFNFTAAADFLGGDIYTGTENAANNGPSPYLRMWNAWLQWQAIKESQAVMITFGYFPPRIGRESMNPALAVPSMDKAWSQNYLRRHVVGIGPGRSVGLNVGGLIPLTEKVVFEYDLGVFNPAISQFGGLTSGIVTSPMTIGRMALSLGDAEQEQYGLGKKVNYFGKRNGISLGFAAAFQPKQLNFENNTALSFDLLINYGALSIDGDISLLSRKDIDTGLMPQSQTGYIRGAYNFILDDITTLTPTIKYVWFNGESDDLTLQLAALGVGMPSGNESILELGINLYFNKKYKLGVAYTLRDADSGTLSETLRVNNYYYAGGGEIIKRGNWIGLGLVVTI